MFKPDTIAKEELQRVADRLTPWFDAKVVKRLTSAANGKATPKPKPHKSQETDAPASRAAARPDGIPVPDEFTLEECFAIYMLGAKPIADPANDRKDIKYLVRETARWHHQVKANGKPVAFARSKASAYSEGCEICQFYISELAKEVDDAIKWLMKFEAANEAYRQSNPLVRMVAVPAYNVHAFWLLKQKTGQSDLLVIDAPAELVGLKRKRLLSSEKFLKAFKGQKPIAGLVIDGVVEEDAEE